MTEDQPVIPAATLVLFSEQNDRPAEHLMIERAGHLSFAGGALVFPGGRMEEDDRATATDPALSRNRPDDPEDAAARVAAIRETIEEVGMAVAVEPPPDPDTLAAWRHHLAQGEPFSGLLTKAGALLDLDRLVGFARWCPNFRGHRRFDTRFYLAQASKASAVEVDGGEATRHLWMTAQQILDDADAGRHRIIFPTRRNLERLAAYPSFDAAVAHARSIAPRTITPWIRKTDGGTGWLCIPEDAGYPVTHAPLEQAFRD